MYVLKFYLRVCLLFILFSPLFVVAQNDTLVSNEVAITGTVKDKLNTAMSGVSVSNLRSGATTSTGDDGHFEIKALKGDSLSASFVGYGTYSWVFSERIVENITLEAMVGSMEDVVIVGYGQQKKLAWLVLNPL